MDEGKALIKYRVNTLPPKESLDEIIEICSTDFQVESEGKRVHILKQVGKIWKHLTGCLSSSLHS